MAKKSILTKLGVSQVIDNMRKHFINKIEINNTFTSINNEILKKGEIKKINDVLYPDAEGNVQFTPESVGVLSQKTGVATASVSSEVLHLGRKSGKIKNWVLYSTNEDGNIYNNGLGYKTGTRIRSGGAEDATTAAICTGFIPFKIGDTLRIYPPFSGGNTENALNFYDGNFTNFGQQTDSGAQYGNCYGVNYDSVVINGISTFTLTEEHSADIRYVRVTHFYNYNNAPRGSAVNQDVSNFIITVNEEFEASA